MNTFGVRNEENKKLNEFKKNTQIITVRYIWLC